jgi:hypothetical protein
MTKIEKIQNLLGDVEADVRKATIEDILIDLRDFAKDASDDEKPGYLAAIQVIEANYL